MALSIQSSPGLNDNEDIEVIPIPKQDPPSRPLSQATSSAGTRTTNPINPESSAPQTPTPADSASESQGDQEAAQSKKRKLTSEVWEHFSKITKGKEPLTSVGYNKYEFLFFNC
jgi:hypothetical protein